ncbi:hypothetical protein M404DRAFT_993279 [Pisolithus tinctorius Marx 270]|uniref:Uncharacterized protein n=1 Tax=Pisolithus tinctorius Marx 270 TaxID=870435 RepID=A0A0C3KVX0_PISTI|nr:hypothetical protein M404DRAFT_993279 [Pisolithus tinctorius Marx 270]
MAQYGYIHPARVASTPAYLGNRCAYCRRTEEHIFGFGLTVRRTAVWPFVVAFSIQISMSECHRSVQ